jgi:acyl-CoA thioester hydrolase
MGHLNTRNYVGMFDDAAMVLLAQMSASTGSIMTADIGWADVRNEIDYIAEVPPGKILEIYARISRFGNTSLTIGFEMRSINYGLVHARMAATFAHFDSRTRKAVPLPPGLRVLATELGLFSPSDL